MQKRLNKNHFFKAAFLHFLRLLRAIVSKRFNNEWFIKRRYSTFPRWFILIGRKLEQKIVVLVYFAIFQTNWQTPFVSLCSCLNNLFGNFIFTIAAGSSSAMPRVKQSHIMAILSSHLTDASSLWNPNCLQHPFVYHSLSILANIAKLCCIQSVLDSMKCDPNFVSQDCIDSFCVSKLKLIQRTLPSTNI